MSAAGRSARVISLFFNTVVRRVVLSLIGRTLPEIADAGGTYRTVIFQRSRAGDPQEMADFDAVRRDMTERRELPGLRRFVAPATCAAIFFVLAGWMAFSAGLTAALLALAFPVSLSAGILWMTWWTQRNTLESAEQNIAAAWLRQGCCPHCAYRLPLGDSAIPLRRCTECGVNWRVPQTSLQPR